MLEITPDLGADWLLDLWELAPTRAKAADSDGSRPVFRDDLAHHSDLMSLGVPR
jgi:hypothetical protein